MTAVPHFGAGDSTTATAASGTGSALTIAKPANVAVGDLLIGTFYSQFTGSVTTAPSGWTLITTFPLRSGGVYYLAVTDSSVLAGLPSTWSATMSGSGRLCWEVHRVTGVNLSAPLDVTGSASSQVGTSTVTLASISPTTTNALLYGFAYWNNSTTTQSTYTPDAAMTDGEQVKSPTSGNTSGIDIAYQQITSSGATGTRTFSMTPTGASNAGFMFAIESGTSSVSGDSSLTVTTSLSSAATNSTSAATSLASTASLTADTVRATTGASSLAATISLTADATKTTGLSAGATLGATVSLVAAAHVATTAGTSLALTATNTSAANRAVTVGASLAIAAALSSTLQTAAQKWAAAIPLYAGHHGESADRPESTMYGYDGAAAWNKDLALEVSVWQSSDAVWFVSHDQNTGTTQAIGGGNQWNASYDIPTTAAATLDTVSTIAGGLPLMRLSTLLAKYGGNRVLIIDNKGSQDVAGLIAVLNAAGGPAWFLSKSYYTSVAWAGGMRSAGYLTLGYFYDADTANIAANQSKFDVLMEQFDASSGTWSTILAYPQPVMAHIIATSAQKATAVTNGAEGFMASGVLEVVPPTGATASLVVAAVSTATAARAATANTALPATAVLVSAGSSASSVGGALLTVVALTASAVTNVAPPANVTVVGVLVARNIFGSLTAQNKVGSVTARRWIGQLE